MAFAQCPAGTDYGDIRKRDLTLGWNYNAPTTFNATFASPRNSYMASLSYVTGGHNMKVGLMWDTGYRTIVTPMNNGGLQQQYRLGVPDSVVLQTVPSVQDTSIDREIGAYIQDVWTLGRLTLNPGLRFEYIKGSVRDQTAPAGRFLPERVFTQADYVTVPSFADVSPRFGAAYDLFGNGKTALKANFGKYVQSFSSNLGDDYNPMGGGTDTRTWRDLNGDDIAQENELGPTTNLNFGKPANVTRPDPDLKRPYQLLYSAGVQQELLPGLSGSVNYYYRKYYRDFWVDNVVTTARRLLPDPDPRSARQRRDDHRLQHRAGQARRDRQRPIELHRERPRVPRHRSVVQRAAQERHADYRAASPPASCTNTSARSTIRTASGTATPPIRS